MRNLFIVLTILMVNPVWAAAFPARSESEEQYDQCMANALTNAEFRQCGSAYLEDVDRVLNEVWREFYKGGQFSERTYQALLNEQRKWIDFKDSSCLFWHHGFGTAGRDMSFYNCRARIIEDRIKLFIEFMSVSLASVVREPFMSCNNKDPEIIQKCADASKYLQESDAELNRVWREIRNNFKDNEDYKNTWEALLNEQRKWVSLKENSCQYFLNEKTKIGCFGSLTENRTEALKELLDFEN